MNINIPADLRDKAIAEMEESFGFSDGVAEHFEQTLEMAIVAHKTFSQQEPPASTPHPISLDMVRGMSEERKQKFLERRQQSDALREQTVLETRRALAANHEQHLIRLLTIDDRISTYTATRLVAHITGE